MLLLTSPASIPTGIGNVAQQFVEMEIITQIAQCLFLARHDIWLCMCTDTNSELVMDSGVMPIHRYMYGVSSVVAIVVIALVQGYDQRQVESLNHRVTNLAHGEGVVDSEAVHLVNTRCLDSIVVLLLNMNDQHPVDTHYKRCTD